MLLFLTGTAVAKSIPLSNCAAQHSKRVAMNSPEFPVITEVPEGKVIPMEFSGIAYTTFMNECMTVESKGNATEFVETETGDVYIKNIISKFTTNSYVKGKREGNSIVVDFPQPIYIQYWDGEIYNYIVTLCQYSKANGGPVNEGDFYAAGSDAAKKIGLPEIENKIIINVNDDGTYTWGPEDNGNTIIGIVEEESLSWGGYGEIQSTWKEFTTPLITPPADIEIKEMALLSTYDDGTYVSVGIDGDDIYMKGFFKLVPEGWIKGKIQDNKVTFPSSQYVGLVDTYNFYSYFVGASVELVYNPLWEGYEEILSFKNSFTLDYDAESNRFTSSDNQAIVLSRSPESLFEVEHITGPTIFEVDDNIDKTPAKPMIYYYVNEFFDYYGYAWVDADFPLENINGEILNSKKLYYRVFVNGEPYTFTKEEYPDFPYEMTYIPYDFTDNFNIFIDGLLHSICFYFQYLDTLGIQMYYADSVDENGIPIVSGESELVTIESNGGNYYYDEDPNGIESTIADKSIESVTYHDITGRTINKPVNGIFVKTIRYSDGTLSTSKIVK